MTDHIPGQPDPSMQPQSPGQQPPIPQQPLQQIPQGQPIPPQHPVQPMPIPQAQPIPPAYSQPQPQIPPQQNVQQPPMQNMPGQPTGQQMPGAPGQLVQHHVHHSYIWMGTLGVAFSLGIALFFSMFALLIEDEPLVLNGTSYGSTALIGGGILIFFILLVGLTIVLQIFSYKHLYYELGPEEFNFYSGILNKKRVHIPYQRVQSVNQKATLIQRIIGVCTVNIDTAGGSANKAVVIPYIQNTAAEQLRAELFARKQMVLSGQAAQAVSGAQSAAATQSYIPGVPVPAPSAGAPVPPGAPAYGDVPASAPGTNVLDAPAEILSDVRGVFGGMAFDTGAVSYEYGMTNKELIFTGLSNNTGVVVMVMAVLGAIAGVIDFVMQTAIGQWAVDEGTSALMNFASQNALIVVVGIVLIMLVVLWALSIIGTCISYGGFHARRRQNRIEVEHGLLQHQFHGVDIDRVQSVIIKQSFIRRLIGYCELSLGKIDAAVENSGDQQQQALTPQGIVVHPFVKMSKVPEILAGLVPEFADVPTEPCKLPKVALRRAIIRRGILKGNGFWLAVIVVILQIGLPVLIASEPGELGFMEPYVIIGLVLLYALAAISFILDIIGAVMWYRGSSFAYNRHFMQISNGGFSRESVSFPRKKIQFGYTKTNPFQRNAGVATINARTAAGIGGTTFRLLDAYVDDAEAWLEWVKPRRNMVQ